MIDTITLGWIDSGSVEGKFAVSVAHLLISKELPIANVIQTTANVSPCEKNNLIKIWIEDQTDEWLLFVTPNAILYPDSLSKMWKSVRGKDIKIISALQLKRFGENVLPSVYKDSSEGLITINNFQEDIELAVDAFDTNCFLIHRSLVLKMIELKGSYNLFKEFYIDDNYFGDSVDFFNQIKDLGIPIYCHTGAFVDNIKRIMLNPSALKDFNVKNIY